MGTYSVSVSDTDGVSSSFVLDEEGNVLLTQAGHSQLCHAFRDLLSNRENTFGQEEGWAWGLLTSQNLFRNLANAGVLTASFCLGKYPTGKQNSIIPRGPLPGQQRWFTSTSIWLTEESVYYIYIYILGDVKLSLMFVLVRVSAAVKTP